MDYPHSYRHVDDAIISRRSIRKFLSTPVEQPVVEDILDVARRAPSGVDRSAANHSTSPDAADV